MLRAYLAPILVLLILTGCANPARASTSDVVTRIVPQTVVVMVTVAVPQTVVVTATPPAIIGPPAPTPQCKLEPMSVRQVYALVTANLRAGCSINHAVVGSVQPGAPLNVDGFSVTSGEKWLHIVSGEWIRGDLVGDATPSPTNTPTLLVLPTPRPSTPTVPPPSPTIPPPPPTVCIIKGNVSFNTGERIYHVPGCPYYDATVIDERYGERWFCSEDEARANGWRKAWNCP